VSDLLRIHVTDVRVTAALRGGGAVPEVVPLLIGVTMDFQGPARFTADSALDETLDYGRIVRLIGADVGGGRVFDRLDQVADLVADGCMALDARVRHVRVGVVRPLPGTTAGDADGGRIEVVAERKHA